MVNLIIYDTLRKRLNIIVDEYKSPCVYSANINFNRFASGTYFVKMFTGTSSKTIKLPHVTK
ncbi:MAG: hypothetical protein KKB34_14990 [Bacteroidetes bacterium]|nr:hypothetical protein [Bacteroidota bacterium]